MQTNKFDIAVVKLGSNNKFKISLKFRYRQNKAVPTALFSTLDKPNERDSQNI